MSDDTTSAGDDPDGLGDVLADVAEERGLTRRELLTRLLADDGTEPAAVRPDDLDDLGDRVEALESSVDELDDELDEKIQDVRERVIQVKREADAKAPDDHGHPDVEAGLRRIGENLDALGNDFVELDAGLVELEERVSDLDDRLDRGFANYEEVLEYLIDVTDDLNRKVDSVATAVVEVRERVGRLEAADAKRRGVDGLRESAQAHGVTEAKCEDCGEPVHVGLLTGPSCPHCGEPFAGLRPNPGFFRSSVLETGRRPALEGDVEREATDLDAIVADEAEEPPAVGAPGSESGDTGSVDGASDPDHADASGDDAGAGGSTDWTAGEGDPAGENLADLAATGDAGDRGDGDPPRNGDTGDRWETGGAEDDSAPRDAGGAEGEDGAVAAERSVDAVPGIGSAYAERLRAAGVDTVGALADADPARIADRTDVAPGRVDTWVGRAREMTGAD